MRDWVERRLYGEGIVDMGRKGVVKGIEGA